MAYDRFLIAPYKNGLRSDLPSWLTLDDSFQVFNNVNITKGAIKKRFGAKLIGSQFTSRAKVALLGAGAGITDVAGDAAGVAGTIPGIIFKEGQQLAVENQVFTVYQTGAMYSTGTATGTFNLADGAFTITGAAALTQIYFYPCEPIMGITHYEKGPVNEHTTYAFDTQFIYKYSGSTWVNDSSFTGPFHGSNKQFFWSTNYLGTTSDQIAIFTTNFNATAGPNPPATDDPIYYFDGTTWANFSAYTKFNSASDIVSSCKIIIAWKNRLLLLNTMEKDIALPVTNYAHPNRVRYSHNGNPFSNNAWLQRRQIIGTDIADGGGYIDAPVEEQIMSAVLIKDRLIVYFERSTWELAYTGNTGLPFIWKAISNYIGCESTFSTVSTESEVVTVDTTGVYACNGSSLNKIDTAIPDFISTLLKSAEGTSRVHGVRDYHNKLIYWSFLDNASSTTHEYPDKILVYNYDNGSWSIYDDTITAFGYFEQSTDATWADPGNWNTTETWGSFYSQGKSRRIIAGNHKGYFFKINNDYPRNADVMPIADLTVATGEVVIPDHNLRDGEYVHLKDNTATPTLIADNIYKVQRINANEIVLSGNALTGTYNGNATLARVSEILMVSKDWNPYIKTADRVYLAKMDFCVVQSEFGEINVDYFVDRVNAVNFFDDSVLNNSNMGDNTLFFYGNTAINPLDAYKPTLWNTVYFQALGDHVTIEMYLAEAQMLNKEIALSPFALQGMVLYTMKEGK